MATSKTLAWHFTGNTLRDGRRVPPNGEVLRHDGPVGVCQSGLHASRDPFDALRYAPGTTLCLVEVGGIVYEQRDKLVCRQRKIIARMDATELLCYFSRMQALSCLDYYPDGTGAVVFDWLMTGDPSLSEKALHSAQRVTVAAGAARAAAVAARMRGTPGIGWMVDLTWAWEMAARSVAKGEFNLYVAESFCDYL